MLVAALLLSVGASASASAASWPPPPSQTWHVIKIGHVHTRSAQFRTCMVREARAKVARWLAPVACEQPPRSEVLIPVLLGG